MLHAYAHTDIHIRDKKGANQYHTDVFNYYMTSGPASGLSKYIQVSANLFQNNIYIYIHTYIYIYMGVCACILKCIKIDKHEHHNIGLYIYIYMYI